jgi:hypothetical protein
VCVGVCVCVCVCVCVLPPLPAHQVHCSSAAAAESAQHLRLGAHVYPNALARHHAPLVALQACQAGVSSILLHPCCCMNVVHASSFKGLKLKEDFSATRALCTMC